jgi:hypothetical protein
MALNQRDIEILAGACDPIEPHAPRNPLLKAFKRAGAAVREVTGQLGVSFPEHLSAPGIPWQFTVPRNGISGETEDTAGISAAANHVLKVHGYS